MTLIKPKSMAFALIALVGAVNAVPTAVALDGGHSNHSAQFEQKLYRQALYHYFNGDYAAALRQIDVNRQRFGADNPQSQLFEAGLQINVGMHQQATSTLTKLSQYVAAPIDANSDSRSATSPTELKQIAALQLAEQLIAAGDQAQAKQVLQQLPHVSANHQHQYQVLLQLAYWPQQAPNLANRLSDGTSNGDDKMPLALAYVQLNQSLLEIEQQQYQKAEQRLKSLQIRYLELRQPSFWQLLFSPFSAPDPAVDIQRQAVHDYAKLLQAQLYLKQQRFQASFTLLQSFPQHGPYSEAALFMFAFAANKIGQAELSTTLFTRLQQQYPNSHLGWQATLIAPQQLAAAGQLEPALAAYLTAERHFLAQLEQLDQFSQQLNRSNELLELIQRSSSFKSGNSATTLDNINTDIVHADNVNTDIISTLPWLNKALSEAQLKAHFRRLIELEQIEQMLIISGEQSDWLGQAVILNQQRKQRLVERQQSTPYQQQLDQLNAQQSQVAALINSAQQSQQGQLFATATEQDWLNRIERSQGIIELLTEHGKSRDYQQRLDRINGVLRYQLDSELPKRLWRHKQQLQALQQRLEQAERQHDRVSQLSQTAQLHNNVGQRHQQAQQQLGQLQQQITTLEQATDAAIRSGVNRFISGQRANLQQLLLSARHRMAATIEQLDATTKEANNVR